jgi:amino acid adenylation domain-containing protein
MFAEIAARWPDRVAVTDGTRELTYAELDCAANRLAHRLRAVGAGPERLVGLCAERTVDLVVGVLAILKSGAGYVPLDPRHPPGRLAATLSDAQCPIVLGDKTLCAPLVGDRRVFVPLAPLPDEPDEPDTPPETGVRPGNVAYVIYTSGSTGKPKGVVVTHANVTRLFTATEDDFGFGPADVWTLFHSIAFDFSVWELWGALWYGGRLVVVPYLTSRDPVVFLELLRAERVTVLNQTPTAFKQLAAAVEEAGFPPHDLRVVVFGGEALDPATLRDWVGGYGAVRPRLVNMYGITETTVHVTIRPIGVADLTGATSPIGRPIADLRVHVLDEKLAEVPPGVEGEMYIGGPGVARGYLNRPELTAQRFVRDPFGGSQARLYRSGDLAVRRPDGELDFRGRADSQVQHHGFRIEPGEIERALLEAPGVRAAACVLREDLPGGPRLVAYLVPGGDPVVVADVRAALLERLPEHMVPTSYVELAALPLSANGKLDQLSLPAPSSPDSALGATRVAPRTPAERTLAKVWSKVLGVAEPNVHDNFFTVGGDSIVAIRLGAAARAAGLPVTIERIFRHPTIAELALVCEEPEPPPARDIALSTTMSDVDVALLPGVTDGYPTAAMQLGILYECELADEDSQLYHDLISVRLAARFDLPVLERALAAVCARHELLRTSFDLARFREPMQFVRESAVVPVTVQRDERDERDELDEVAANTALGEWWRRDKAVPFDIGRPPLVRCHVLVRSPESFQLSLSVHHVAFDGWSLARLAADVLLAYDAGLARRSMRLAPPLARYRDFVAAEQAAVADPAAERFWRDRLTTDPPRLPELPGGEVGAEHAFRATISSDVDSRLRVVAGELGVPPKSLYLAAHARALQTLTGSAEVVTGLQVHGRLEEDSAEAVLGLFLNIVPVHINVRGTWAALAAAAFAAERNVQPHRRYPLARIQQLAGPGREPFETVFNYTDFHLFADLDGMTEVRPLDWWLSDRHSFPLLTEITRSPQAGTRVVKASTSAESPFAGTAVRLGELVLRSLEEIAADPYEEIR